MDIRRTLKGATDMRSVKPAATRFLNGIKSEAKGTVNNMLNGGTGTYKRNSVKEVVGEVKSAASKLRKKL
jgi:hypothetical protein